MVSDNSSVYTVLCYESCWILVLDIATGSSVTQLSFVLSFDLYAPKRLQIWNSSLFMGINGDFTTFFIVDSATFEIKKMYTHTSYYNTNGMFDVVDEIIYFQAYANDPELQINKSIFYWRNISLPLNWTDFNI